MNATRLTTARLTHLVCGMLAIGATRMPAQGTTTWQATTATTWSSDDGCASLPASAGRALASSETVSGQLGLGAFRRASVDVSGAVAVGEPACGANRWSGLGTVRTSFGSPRLQAWVAYTALNTGAPDTAVRQAGISAGIQRRIGRAIMSMSVGPRRDRTATQRAIELTERRIPDNVWALPGTTVSQVTMYVPDTVTRPATRRIPDVGLALSWTYRALGFDAAAHLGLANEMQRADPMARVQLTYDLGPRVSAIAGVVSRSAIPSLDIPARQFATLGFRLGGGRVRPPVLGGSSVASASEFRVVRDTAGQVLLAVRAPQAQRVEVAGDFTHWAPLDLQRGTDGWWRARVHATPGAHQLSIRVDGAHWTAPPGLPPVRDEFGATVGLLTVQ